MGLRDLQYIYRARMQGPAKLVYFSLALARLRLKPISDLLSKWQEVEGVVAFTGFPGLCTFW